MKAKKLTCKNYCPSCSGGPDKAFTLEGVKHYRCANCGYMAPQTCFDSLENNDQHRLKYSAAIMARNDDDTKKVIIEELEHKLKELKGD